MLNILYIKTLKLKLSDWIIIYLNFTNYNKKKKSNVSYQNNFYIPFEYIQNSSIIV